jgi:hypothetical protein
MQMIEWNEFALLLALYEHRQLEAFPLDRKSWNLGVEIRYHVKLT